MSEVIDIFHTNDLHSHLEMWPRIRRYLLTQKAQQQAAGHQVLTFDLGDAMDRTHPLTEATNGQCNTQLLNEIGYTAVTIGNNEGIGNSQTQLNQLYQKANFPVILGNLHDRQTGAQPSWAQPTKVIVTDSGLRIGVLGLTAPYIATYRPNGWEPSLAQDALPGLLATLKGQVDYIILLSHLGLDVDRWIARQFPEINLIIGSHTHHLLPEGLQVNHSWLAAAGRFGDHVGHIRLTVSQGQVTQTQVTVVTTSDLPEKPGDEAEIEGWATAGHQQLQAQTITTLPKALPVSSLGHSPAIDVALAAVATAAGTDVAILNTGLFHQGFPAGRVTADDLHTELPHAMHLLRTTLRGTDVWRLVQEIEKNRLFLQHYRMHGLGFRGKIFGDLVYYGLTYDADNRTVLWQGKPLEPDRYYTLAGVDTYLYFQFYPTIDIMGANEVLFPGVLRNAVADYFMKTSPGKV
jgi:2',3'-cyclic-nucleotide 2'-phosphodiesterase (5'-nucleotidase family)